MKISKVAVSALALFSFAGSPAIAQPLNWWECPYTYCADPVGFQAFLNQAKTQVVRGLYLGDSQETSPAGQGYVYIPRWNWGLNQMFGTCSETPVGLANFSSQIATQWNEAAADWLIVNAQNAPYPQAGNTPAGWLPPHLIAARYGTSAVNAGNLVVLQQNAESVNPGANLTGAPYFDTSHGVELEVFATTQPTSGDVRWYAKPNMTGLPDYSSAVTNTGTLGLSLSNGTLSVLSGTTGPLNFNGMSHMQVDLYGTDDNNPTQIIGSRFRSLGKEQKGMVISSFSAGGYRATHLIDNHSGSGPVLQAMGFSFVIIGYGANESGIFTPEQHKATVLADIQWCRDNISPDLFFVLCTDPFNTYVGPSPNNFDRFAGVEYQIAQEDTLRRVVTINSRRGTEDGGCSATGNYQQHLTDGVHQTPYGQRFKADFELGMLKTHYHYCYANCDGSTTEPILTGNDFQCFLNAYAAGSSYANCDGSQGFVPNLTANDFICFMNAFAAGCS